MPLPCRARLPLVALALSIAACAQKTPPAGTAAPELGPTLTAYHWQLDSALDGGGEPIPDLFPGPANRLGLEFVDGQLGVSGGCNRIGASYRLVGTSQLEVGASRSTMMACPPPLEAADKAIADLLTGTLQAELGGESGAPRLRLIAADGSLLDFQGTPTPETRFGGPGTRAFLEVAAAPCDPPQDTAAGCLKVRDIHFDEQGLRAGEPGAWRALPGGIEGFTPDPGHQQVVRVKRFESAGAAGGEHFVFDMVVESRRVP